MNSGNDRAALKERLDEVAGHLAAGRRAQAYEAARALVAGYPDAARAHNILGILKAGDSDNAGAVASFLQATILEPGFAEAHYNLGLALCQQGKFDPAAECLQRARELDPRNAAIYVVLGNAQRQLGKAGEAAASYEQALELGGVSEALIRNNLGAVLLDLNAPEQAAAAFRRALELEPNSGSTRLNLGNALLRLGRTEEAVRVFESAVKLDPRSANAALLYANALRDVGRLEEAIAGYKTVLQLRPDDKQAAYHLGLVLLELGRTKEGLRAIADGPGVAHISAGRGGDLKRQIARIDIATRDTPTFIGAWQLSDPVLCDRLISFFERNSDRHGAGRTGMGIDKTTKDSTDLTVLPKDLGKPGFEAIADYLLHLEDCYSDYVDQWPFLRSVLPRGDIVPFTIQRYGTGGHFQRIHSERTSAAFAYRVFAWMTYLDDVEDGGETRFHHFGIDVRPKRGKTLIWPAEWTHAHSGAVVRRGHKHIITGWIHFPL